jgi:hypothetical protein
MGSRVYKAGRPGLRRTFFRVSLLGLSFVGLVIGISRYYAASPIYTVQSFTREIALEVIELCLRIYDPSTETRPLLGPSCSQKRLKPVASDSNELQRLVGSKFPKQSVAMFEFNNGPLARGRYRFGYQTVSDPLIRQMAKKYNLYDVISDKKDDFEQILAIANWVQSRWIHGTSGQFDADRFDADVILEQAKNGARFWCHVYCMTFIQLAASMGVSGRLVGLSKDGYARDHAVAEVWSNFHQKWIMIDVDFNIWYTREGIPLSVLEIHNALMDGRADLLRIERGQNRPIPEYESRIASLIGYYRYFDVDLRNDWLTNHYFPGHPARSDEATLWWQDGRLPPVLHFKTPTSNPNDLYWDVNRVHLSFSPSSSPEKITVYMDTMTPNFDNFAIVVDASKLHKVVSCEFEWELHEGVNSVEAWPVNSIGQKGISSRIVISVH